MVSVKVPQLPPLPGHAELHIAALTGRLLEVVRQTLMDRELDGLRNTHFRLLGWIPPGGATHAELARVLFMTKQAVGQFVTQLQSTGHLEVSADEHDRRRRVVRRTSRGDRVVEEVEATMGALEQYWSDLVGSASYSTFRSVLEQIARDSQGALTGPGRADATQGRLGGS